MAADLSSSKIWLVGRHQSKFEVSRKLPTKRDVLAVFTHYHDGLRETIRASATAVAEGLLAAWHGFSVKTSPKQHIITKVERLFKRWVLLKKNRNNKAKRSVSLENKEAQFTVYLKGMFNIAHANVHKLLDDGGIKVLQTRKRNRMEARRKKLIAYQLEEDTKKRKRIETIKKRKTKEIERCVEENESVMLMSSQETKSSGRFSHIDLEYRVERHPPSTSSRHKIIDSDVSTALDRTNVSDRKATLILASSANAMGFKTSELSLSRSTVIRNRKRTRSECAKRLRESFPSMNQLTVHWDGKLLPDLTGNKSVDRLPVVVSAGKFEQLLGIPKLDRGTGVKIGTAVYEAIVEWNIRGNIVAMSFDTTVSNTGYKNGACVHLQNLLKKELLWLSCRHHVHELLLEAAFSTCMGGATTGPNIIIFKRFRESWSTLDHTTCQTGLNDTAINSAVLKKRHDILDFVQCMLQDTQPRDDYRELLKLVRIFLGNKTDVGFYAPGAIHRARWMARAIYSLKIYFFRDQFKLTKTELTGLRRICVFVSTIYVKAWFQAPCALTAPNNDLCLLKMLKEFEVQDAGIPAAALKKFSNHLWYLSEELICLSFFDENISDETKREMIESLKRPGSEDRKVKAFVNEKDIRSTAISSFVTENSLKFFEIIKIEPTFLSCDPRDWKQDANFSMCENICKQFRVVNDSAERGVALMEQFNRSLTTNEEQKQYLLQVVSEHRKKIPVITKATI